METIIGLGVSVVLNIVLIVKIMLLQKKHAQHTVTEEGIRQAVTMAQLMNQKKK